MGRPEAGVGDDTERTRFHRPSEALGCQVTSRTLAQAIVLFGSHGHELATWGFD
jgi:hypothetical protein